MSDGIFSSYSRRLSHRLRFVAGTAVLGAAALTAVAASADPDSDCGSCGAANSAVTSDMDWVPYALLPDSQKQRELERTVQQ